jgi:effector-binding domain-containing protein
MGLLSMNEYIKKLGRIFKYLDKETIIKIERKYHNEAEMLQVLRELNAKAEKNDRRIRSAKAHPAKART